MLTDAGDWGEEVAAGGAVGGWQVEKLLPGR